MTKPQSIETTTTFSFLWLHECQRVFYDRLINEQDRDFFKDLAMELLGRKFKENKVTKEELFSSNVAENQQKVTFSMILKADYDDKLYE